MKSILNAMSGYFERVPDQVRKRKWLVWFFFIAATIFASFGLNKTTYDMTMERWFKKNDPVKVALDKFKAEFGSDNGVYIVYKPKDGNVFSAKSLKAVRGIREDLLNFRSRVNEGDDSAPKHIVKITTLVNAPVLAVENDSLRSRPLVGTPIPTSQHELDEIRRTAESQKTFPLLYFSKDLHYGGISIETDFGVIPMDAEPPTVIDSREELEFEDELVMDEMTMEVDDTIEEQQLRFKPTDPKEYLALMRAIKAILNKPEYADHLEYYPVGNATQAEYDAENEEKMGMMLMAMLVIMVVLLWFLFRSLSAVIWPLSIVVLSTIWTVGLTGWLNISVSFFLILTVMLILTVGMADAVHILSGYLFFRNNGHEHQSALRMAYRKSGVACLLTTLTTMIGMLALTMTPIAPIAIFGCRSAAGVGLALVFTIYLLPLMLDLWSPVKKETARQDRLSASMPRYIPNVARFLQNILERILPVVQKSPVGVAVLFLALFGMCLYGAIRVTITVDFMSGYREDSHLRRSYEIVDRKMMGTQNMEIYLDLKTEGAFQDPVVLNIMDELQHTIQHDYRESVVRTTSLADVVKDASQTLNEGREEMYVIPANQQMLSQTLFLFDNANPADRRKLVSDDYSRSHISVQLYNADSAEYLAVFDRMRQDVDEAVTILKQKYPNTKVSVTGTLPLMMQVADYVFSSTAKSFGLALIVISLTLLVVFGSFRAGLISVIPNLIPATLTFGLLGWLGMPLDMSLIMIGPLIIGIAVDDTIHFITHYRGEVLIDGDVTRALHATIKEVGQAIMFTSLILGLGFGIMTVSSDVGTANMGRFGALAVFAALLCDLFLLPACILIFKPRFQRQRAKQPVVLTNP